MDKGITPKKMQLEADLAHVSNSTARGILNNNGYRYLQTRLKELLSKEDLKSRKESSRNMILYPDKVWKRDICFYLDGSSFVHKTHQQIKLKHLVLESREKPKSVLTRG